MKSGNVLLGILGGFVAGATVGVLFAPDKGSNTRKKIAKKSSELKDNVKEGFNDFLTSVEDQYHHLTSKAEDLVDEGRSNLEKMNSEFKK